VLSHFVYLSFSQLVILSTCHFVNLSFCQLVILSTCHFVSVSFCQLVIFSTFQVVILSSCDFFMQLFWYEAKLSNLKLKTVPKQLLSYPFRYRTHCSLMHYIHNVHRSLKLGENNPILKLLHKNIREMIYKLLLIFKKYVFILKVTNVKYLLLCIIY
jgi:hypothetical protein